MLRDAVFIARADLSQMLRQRETLLWVFVMPAIFFYFIGTVTGGFGRPRGDRPDPLALRVTERDTGFVVDELVRRLEGQRYAVTRATSAEAFLAAPRRLRLELPEGEQGSVTDAVLAGRQVRVVVSEGDDALRAGYDRVRIGRAVYGLVADLAVTKVEGTTPSGASLAEVEKRPRAMRLVVSSAGRRVSAPTGFSQAIPGTMVMFTMLVLLTSGAILLVQEREAGLLKRLAATPIAPASLVAGKWLARMALGLVQIAFAMAVGTLVFKMDWGQSLPMVGVVLVSWAAFNASLALLLGNLARSANQMAGIGVLSTMVLAALGGCWWPIEIAPSWMQSLALALPTGWCMDAMHKLVNFGDPATFAVPHALAMGVGAILLGWVGVRTFRYQ
jgi:ABC-type multidrug transport system permease subunit